MKKRKELTPEEIINKVHYRSILLLIEMYHEKKIRFLHLRFALLEQHNIILSDKNKQDLKDVYGDELKNLHKYAWVEQKIGGKRGINNLTNFLDRLNKLKLISKKKDPEDRFHYYKLTKLGENILGRWYVKFLMDELVPDEAVIEIASKIGEITAKYGIKKPDKIL